MSPRPSWPTLLHLAPLIVHLTATAGCGGTTTADAASATATGGTPSGGGGAGGSTTTTAGGGGSSTSSSGDLRCSQAGVICDMMPVSCPFGEVPRLNEAGTCYGNGCVSVGECACAVPTDCPDPGQYTCNRSLGRCTPYLR